MLKQQPSLGLTFPAMGRDQLLLDEDEFSEVVIPEWERSFAVVFARDAFAHATTVGQVLAVVRQQVQVHGLSLRPMACSSLRLFYRLRRELLAQGVARADLRPQTPLTTLFPWRTRARRWGRVRQACAVPLPALRQPAGVFVSLWVGVTLSTWGLFTASDKFIAVLCGLASALVVGGWSWTRLAFPVNTLGELVHAVQAQHYYHMRGRPFYWREVHAIVLAGLVRCSAENEDVQPKELSQHTRLV